MAGRSPSIDWHVEQGDIWLLDGNVGSGKTTLIKLLSGLIKPASGRVVLFGSDIHRLSQRRLARLRERLGVVFERDGLIASWTVGENLVLPLRYRGSLKNPEEFDRHIETELMAIGESTALLGHRVSQLTGRQRRRIALLRTVLLEPELVLMDDLPLYLHADEPETAVLLERLTGDGTTLIACAPATWARYFPEQRSHIAHLDLDRFDIHGGSSPNRFDRAAMQ